jgi:hypothetical protein
VHGAREKVHPAAEAVTAEPALLNQPILTERSDIAPSVNLVREEGPTRVALSADGRAKSDSLPVRICFFAAPPGCKLRG